MTSHFIPPSPVVDAFGSFCEFSSWVIVHFYSSTTERRIVTTEVTWIRSLHKSVTFDLCSNRSALLFLTSFGQMFVFFRSYNRRQAATWVNPCWYLVKLKQRFGSFQVGVVWMEHGTFKIPEHMLVLQFDFLPQGGKVSRSAGEACNLYGQKRRFAPFGQNEILQQPLRNV